MKVCHNNWSIPVVHGVTAAASSLRHCAFIGATQYCKTGENKKEVVLTRNGSVYVVQLSPTSKAIMTIKPATVVHDAS